MQIQFHSKRGQTPRHPPAPIPSYWEDLRSPKFERILTALTKSLQFAQSEVASSEDAFSAALKLYTAKCPAMAASFDSTLAFTCPRENFFCGEGRGGKNKCVCVSEWGAKQKN